MDFNVNKAEFYFVNQFVREKKKITFWQWDNEIAIKKIIFYKRMDVNCVSGNRIFYFWINKGFDRLIFHIKKQTNNKYPLIVISSLRDINLSPPSVLLYLGSFVLLWIIWQRSRKGVPMLISFLNASLICRCQMRKHWRYFMITNFIVCFTGF